MRLVLTFVVVTLALVATQTFAVEAALPLPAKRIDKGGFRGEARLRLKSDTILIGDDLIVECEFKCTSGSENVTNGLLSERRRLPAQIVVTSADGSRRWELLQEAPEVVLGGLPISDNNNDVQTSRSSDETLGRNFTFRMGAPPNASAGFSSVRSLDLSQGEYFAQAIYNGWLTQQLPTREEDWGRATGKLLTDAEVLELVHNIRTRLAEPIAVSEPVHFTVTPPLGVKPTTDDHAVVPSTSVRLELQRLPLPAHVHRALSLEFRIHNDSSEAIELFNPLLNPLLWTNRAVSLNIFDSEGKHVVDLLQRFSGSSISVGRKDWVYLPPGGYVVTREKFDLSSDGWFSGARLGSLWGSFKLQLAATDRLTLPRPRLQADGIGLDRHQKRDEEWYAAFPGKVQVRSNAIEFKLPATLGK